MLLPGNVILNCRIKDLSRSGALIVFAMAQKLPEFMGLRIGTSRTVRDIAVAWRGTGELGARFVDAS